VSATGQNLAPGEVEARIDAALTEARAALKKGAPNITAARMRGLLRSRAQLGDKWKDVAELSKDSYDYFAAENAARRYLALNRDEPDRTLLLARILLDADKAREALPLAEALFLQVPHEPRLAFFAASCAARAGETDRALSYLHKAVAMRPTYGSAWHLIAWLKRFEAGDPDIDAMKKAWDSGQIPDGREKAAIGFGIGKALDDLDEVDEGFAYVSQAAEMMAKETPFSADDLQTYVDDLRRTFDDSFFRNTRGAGAPGKRSIFVVGMPRSGTTLVEQILGAHSGSAGGGELPFMQVATHALGTCRGDRIQAFLEFSKSDDPLGKMGGRYLELMSEQFGLRGHVVDKALNNTFKVGLIAKMLSEAPIIWMQRDPGAIAWSSLRVMFAGQHGWSYGQQRLAARIRAVDQLHEHFAALLPDRVLTAPYESLTAAPEEGARRIVTHCGLEMESGVLDFHKSRKGVSTAAMTQVREPIHTRAVDRWKRYEAHLQPFLDAYYGSDR